MTGFNMGNRGTKRWRKYLTQQRISDQVNHLRPQRWDWYSLVRPLDHSLARQADRVLPDEGLRNLRYFWLDGLFAAISENFYLGFIALFALAYGASNSQVGMIEASANMLGALALFPGAKLVEKIGKRKPIVVWSGGGFSRLAFLALAVIPFLFSEPLVAILAITMVNGFRAFMANIANPAWTALVADLVPESIRGRFFASRNMAMGLAALVVTPLAGRIISLTNDWLDSLFAGYQAIFVLTFLAGMVSTLCFARIQESGQAAVAIRPHQRGDLRRAIRQSPGFTGLVISALVWNMSLHVAAPFFNVYLVSVFQASTVVVGVLAGIASLTALFGQRIFGPLLDKKGAFWVQSVTGLLIPLAPLAWVFVTTPWQVGIINTFTGFLWAGYNLSNFNLLLELTPAEQRPRAVAVYQTAVFGSAVIGPLLGGYLADAISFRFIFGLSSAGRFLGMALFLYLVMRPRRKLEMRT